MTFSGLTVICVVCGYNSYCVFKNFEIKIFFTKVILFLSCEFSYHCHSTYILDSIIMLVWIDRGVRCLIIKREL